MSLKVTKMSLKVNKNVVKSLLKCHLKSTKMSLKSNKNVIKTRIEVQTKDRDPKLYIVWVQGWSCSHGKEDSRECLGQTERGRNCSVKTDISF